MSSEKKASPSEPENSDLLTQEAVLGRVNSLFADLNNPKVKIKGAIISLLFEDDNMGTVVNGTLADRFLMERMIQIETNNEYEKQQKKSEIMNHLKKLAKELNIKTEKETPPPAA